MHKKESPLQRLWYGEAPKKLRDVFSGETPEQRVRREAMYFPRASALLRKAVLDLNKVVAANEFVAQIPEWVQTQLSLTRGMFLGHDMPAENVPLWAIELFYNIRLLNPNGILYYNPITSRIEYYETQEKESAKTRLLPPELKVPYDKYIFVFEDGRTLAMQGEAVVLEYNYAAGIKMATFLGGTTKDKWGRYESDFHFAIAELERLEVLGSQLDAATLLTYPKLITSQIDCRECEGTGLVDGDKVENDLGFVEQVACKSCNGKGHHTPNIFERLEIPPDRTQMGETQTRKPLSDYMQYLTPDIASPQFNADRMQATLDEVKEMLNLARWQDGSVSGVAKRVDNEAGQPRLRAIMHSFFAMVQHVFRIAANAMLTPSASADDVWAIRFQIPQYIDLRTIADLQAQISELPNLDLYTRYQYQITVLRKSYREDEIPQLRACFEATQGNCFLTQDERLNLLGAGVMDAADVWLSVSATSLAAVAAQGYTPNEQQSETQYIVEYLLKAVADKRATLAPPANPFNNPPTPTGA